MLLFGFFSPLFASKRILVDLSQQIAVAYQDGKILFYGRVSTGKPGRRTPTGSFYVREKDIDHVSNLWPKPNGGAKMHYMLRITRDGIAMHLGPTPDYPASHGCIRMQDGFAQKMFAWAQKGTPVDIVGTPPVHSPPVVLSSLAKSARMLRRSLGGGTGRPIDVISTNPKVHQSPLSIADAGIKPIVEYKPRHFDPLRELSSNPKIHRRTTASNKRRVVRKRNSVHNDPLSTFNSNPKKKRVSKKRKKSKRKTYKRKTYRNRHPNPLKAVSNT